MNSFILHNHATHHTCHLNDFQPDGTVSANNPKNCISLPGTMFCVIQRQTMAHLFTAHRKECKKLPFVIGCIPGHEKNMWYGGVALLRWLKQEYMHPVLETAPETVVFYRYTAKDKTEKQHHFHPIAVCTTPETFVQNEKKISCFDPENVGARIHWILQQNKKNKINSAHVWIQRILHEPIESSEFENYLVLIRQLLQSEKQKDLGLKLFHKVFNETTEIPSLIVSRAILLLKGDTELGVEKDPEKARYFFLEALHSDPTLTNAAKELAVLLNNEGRESHEIAQLLFEIVYSQSDTKNLCNLIEDLRLVHDDREICVKLAAILCNMGLAQEPENHLMLTSLAAIFTTSAPGMPAQPEKAREIFCKIIEKFPEHPFALLHLGELYRDGSLAEGKDYSRAHQYFSRALEHNKDNVFGMHASACLGWLLHKGGYGIESNYVEAKLYYEHALRINDEYIFAIESLAELLFECRAIEEQNIVEAKSYFKKVLDLDPDRAFSLHGLAKIYALNASNSEKHRLKALECAQKALQLYEKDEVEIKDECLQLIKNIQRR